MSIFVSTGEVSGDLYAAGLISELRRAGYDQPIWGMGGSLAAGLERYWSNESLQIMGLSSVLRGIPRIFRLSSQIVEQVIRRRPDAVVLVDSPDFHVPLARRLRRAGFDGPIVDLCPPTVWAWRRGRAKALKKYCTLCLPLFDFEARVLKTLGVPAVWEGYPLIDDVSRWNVGAPNEDEKTVALMPGSRLREVRSLLPILERVGIRLRKSGFRPVLSLASGLRAEGAQLIRSNKAGLPVFEGPGRELMARSRFVVAASGTVAVEAMLLDRFMVVLYRGSLFEWSVFNLLRLTPFVSVPNVLAGWQVYPELIQDKCREDLIWKAIRRYVSSSDFRSKVHRTLAANRRRMGTPGVFARWARRVLELMEHRQ
ncbi:lipid A disaccharide synthetase [Jonquetella anthropi DSM 22815]|uniref:Lipid-A-disaccharide synthase n=1 Tax=Jonquetella anthropi DSM 22815 TaxID=885272 RepID=H0UKJ8_9BACT|nr:lipid-A-disaccharide synthase [Jonquetella anthropi]EHM13207.1 lipid A disaccharide synthetase [Jonquetella anthropi DSM 22815]